MSSQRIGQLTLTGTDAQIAHVSQMAETIADVISDRVEPAECLWLEPAQMPFYAPGKHALGYWRDRAHKILISTAARATSMPKILAHESIHWLDDDFWLRWHRRHLMPMLIPEPDSYRDDEIGGELHPYVAAPSECLAVWLSAAVLGADPPVFRSIYLRRIPRPDFPQAAEIALLER